MEISFQDLITKLREIKAIDFPLQKIVTITEDTMFLDILSIIVDQKVAILEVKNQKNKVLGFITMKDFIVLFIPQHSDIHAVLSRKQMLSSTRASDLAKTQFPVVYDDTPLKEIAELMDKYETNFLPRAVSKQETEIIGIILLKDLIARCGEVKQRYKILSEEEENGVIN
ncbi:MAG: CBS domain-containing protein [Candidatus Heimdallarchaeota archaeon]|nr:CBS domain-containing protein [Candidatus Heimdallarchaeota archaeon]MCK4955592.1 CBS domain-containing protein [Candidatus Heimdallarchaeota archaeon]